LGVEELRGDKVVRVHQETVVGGEPPHACRGGLEIGRVPVSVEHDQVAGGGPVDAGEARDGVVDRLVGQGEAGEEVAREADAPAVAGDVVGEDTHAAVVDPDVGDLPGRGEHQHGRG